MICYYTIFSFFMIPFAPIVMGYEGRDVEVFTTLLSGRFSYAKSLSELRIDGIVNAQNALDTYILPINYPALNSEVVLFTYDLHDGKVMRQTFMALNQSGPVIDVALYNVRRSDIFNPASLDISKLESLSRDDLHITPVCQSNITRVGPTLFTAEYANCNVDGFKLATYTATYSCDSLTFKMDSKEFPDNKSKLPYTLTKIENYPVPVCIFPDYDKYKDMCNY